MPKRTPKEKTDANEPTYEQAIEQVEAIADKIEAGEIGLEDSVEQYERGIALIKRCRSILEQAELRVQKLALVDREDDE
jgi:exodeoxyribonuclease VII small subunit